MRINTTTTQYLTAITAALLCLGGAQLASAQTDDTTTPATTAPGASTSPSPTPPAGTATPPAPAPAAPSAPAATAPAPAPAAPAAPQLSYTGLLDVYYLYQFNNPKNLPQNSLGTPAYDMRQNTPTVSLAELNLVYAVPSQGGFGAKATLISGDTADLNAGGGYLGVDPATDQEARFKNIQQLYVTWAAKSGAGLDFGKFYTPYGYEVTESNANYNYSRSDVYFDLLPVYHAGFRFYTQNYNGFTGTLYVVNSISDTANEGVRDDNSNKGFIGVFNYTDPKGKYVAIENIGTSQDLNVFGYSTDKLTLSDTDLTWNVNAASTLGFEYVYRKDDGGSAGTTSTNGYATYYKYTINPKDNLALRWDYVDQKLLGRPWEITGTYSIQTTPKFLTRFEYRYDKIYAPYGFAASDGSFTAGDQSTVSVSEVFTF